MSDAHLPTAEQMLFNAATELKRASIAAEECLAWLRSDWRPVGTPLTDEQAARKQLMQVAVVAIKRAVEAATREGT